MLKIFSKILRTGIVTEPLPQNACSQASECDSNVDILGEQVKAEISRCFAGSLAIRQVDAGSCNGCELEIHALNNPFYAVERFGIHFVASPRHADMLLVTGPTSRHMETALLHTYEATPSPKLVVAVGDCAINGGEFGVSYATSGAIANLIPVHKTIPGCPPTPTDLMLGILSVINK